MLARALIAVAGALDDLQRTAFGDVHRSIMRPSPHAGLAAGRERGFGNADARVVENRDRAGLGLFAGECCPVAERIARRGLYLPSGIGTTRAEVDNSAAALADILK